MEKTATFTYCDSGENHVGMEQLGRMVEENEGFTKNDLDNIKDYLVVQGIECEIIDLKQELLMKKKRYEECLYFGSKKYSTNNYEGVWKEYGNIEK